MFDFVNGAAEKFMEKFFLRLLKPFSREDLDYAVKNNVSLLDETMKHNPNALAMGNNMARRFNGYGHMLNTENVLKWIKEKRYDFYFSIISDQKKKKWLDQQVKEFKEFLFNN